MAVAQSVTVSHVQNGSALDYLNDLVRYAYARLGSFEEAEDVAIEVLQDASRLRRLDKVKNLQLYLLGMTRRKIADHARRRGPETVPLAQANDSHSIHENPEFSLAVRETLRQLPDMYQDVLLLKYVHGLSADEIAAVLGKSKIAARSLVQRSREAFAEIGAHLAEDFRA